jgi:hypothetical protein
MAKIKVINLTNEQKPEMIDLKAEAEKGNSEAITAFKSLRGMGSVRWRLQN